MTFEGDKVVRVKESYAGLGGSVAPPLPVRAEAAGPSPLTL